MLAVLSGLCVTEKGIYVWFVLGGCHSIPRVSTVDG